MEHSREEPERFQLSALLAEKPCAGNMSLPFVCEWTCEHACWEAGAEHVQLVAGMMVRNWLDEVQTVLLLTLILGCFWVQRLPS